VDITSAHLAAILVRWVGKRSRTCGSHEKSTRVSTGDGENLVLLFLSQISPFPFDLVRGQVERCQEEHKNMGYYDYVWPRLLTVVANQKPIW